MAVIALTSSVLLHHAEAIGGDIQLGSLGILQLNELPALVLDIEERHAAISAHAIVDVHDMVAGTEGGKVVQDLRATTRGRGVVLCFFANNMCVPPGTL